MNVGSILFGLFLGIALVVASIVFVMPMAGAPTPESVCENQLSNDWEPTKVNTDMDNKSVQIACKHNNGSTQIVTTDMDVIEDMEVNITQ